MARTITQIQQTMLDNISTDSTLGPLLTSTSAVSAFLLWTYIVATAQWVLENLFDQHKAEVNAIVAAQKPHTLQWYVTIAKLFQYGYSLPPDSDTYSTIDTTAQVVNYAAAAEVTKGIRIKVATLSGGDLAPLNSPQLTAFTAYMQLVKDAGVRLYITSGSADSLKLNLKIYYDALVLDNTGARLDGTATTPVQDAITAFLENLPFNGLYTNFQLLNALAAVEGVVIPEIVSAQATYGALPYTDIESEYTPDAGYLRIITPGTDLTITFIAHGPI